MQHRAERVDVGARVDGAVAGDLLRRHVQRRAERDARERESRSARVLECEGDPEVGDQCMAALQQDVLGLHVAVHDAMAVRVLERIRDLAHQLHRVIHREATLTREPRAQRLAVDERHDVPHQPLRRSPSRTTGGCAGAGATR